MHPSVLAPFHPLNSARRQCAPVTFPTSPLPPCSPIFPVPQPFDLHPSFLSFLSICLALVFTNLSLFSSLAFPLSSPTPPLGTYNLPALSPLLLHTSSSPPPSLLLLGTGSHKSQAGIEFAMYPRMTLNSDPPVSSPGVLITPVFMRCYRLNCVHARKAAYQLCSVLRPAPSHLTFTERLISLSGLFHNRRVTTVVFFPFIFFSETIYFQVSNSIFLHCAFLTQSQGSLVPS